MTLLGRFLVYNLLSSLAAGLLAWLIVFAAIRLLGIRSSAIGFCFLSLPVFKSVLVLLGIGLIFPWPWQWFTTWHNLALAFGQVLPFVFLWSAGIYLIYLLVVQRARRAALEGAQPASEAAPRLVAVYQNILNDFHKLPCPQCGDDLCCTVEFNIQPRLLVSERLNSPLALTGGGEAAILFPTGLASRLGDDELRGALAHELAHFHLRRPGWCSAATLQKMTLINPVAGFLGEYMHRQEEKACDELAIAITGQPEVYAGMLTKSFRYAREQGNRNTTGRLQVLPRLAGFKPLLSERVEHLLDAIPSSRGWKQSRLVIWLVWAMIFSFLFFGFSFIPS